MHFFLGCDKNQEEGSAVNLLTQINQLEHLTSNEKSLCDYIRNHPMECLSKTPQQLAGDLYLSTSTVYRLLKKLDLKGYSDFKVALWTVVHQKSESAVQDINFPIEAEATPDEILLHLKEVYEYTISDTLELADPYAMAQVAEAMERAERIDIYTSAGNFCMADNFRFQMQEINVPVEVPHEAYMQKLATANSNPKHFSIVISFGGRSSTVGQICRLLRQQHSPIALITSTDKTPLCGYADHLLYLSSNEDHYQKISAFSTRTSLMYLLDSLYALYFKRHYKENVRKKLSAYERLHAADVADAEEKVAKWKNEMEKSKYGIDDQ